MGAREATGITGLSHDGSDGPAPSDVQLGELIDRAHGGSRFALGQLLEHYRRYLLMVANESLDSDLRPKGGASDLVQDTFVEAQRDFQHFQGGSEGELAAWLRRILTRNLADQIKHHQSLRRDFHRDQPLQTLVERTHEALAATLSTPSAHAREREQAVLLADALALLPADYREVITLRHVEGRSFQDVAAQMVKYGYDIQAAAYKRAVGAVYPHLVGRIEFVFLFVETEAPFAVLPAEPDGSMQKRGELGWAKAVALWGQCLKSKEWPEYVARGEIARIAAPAWAQPEMPEGGSPGVTF